MKTVFNFTDREDRISKSGINPEILNAFKENPYTQSLTSSVY